MLRVIREHSKAVQDGVEMDLYEVVTPHRYSVNSELFLASQEYTYVHR